MNKLLKISLRGLFLALFLIPSLSYAAYEYGITSHSDRFYSAYEACEFSYNLSTDPNKDHFIFTPGGIGDFQGGGVYKVTHQCKGYNSSGVYILNLAYNMRAYQITCPSGYTEDAGGSCVLDQVDCTVDEGDIISSGYYKNTDIYAASNVITPSFFCTNSCLVQPVCSSTTSIVIENGIEVEYSNCDFVQTAFDCQDGDADSPSHVVAPPEDTCKPGDTYGTLNGKKICIQPDGNLANTTAPNVTEKQTDTTSNSTDNGDGTSTNTKTETTTSSDGTTTTTTTTTVVNNTTGDVVSENVTETKQEGQTQQQEQKLEAQCGAPGQPPCSLDLEGEETLVDPSVTLGSSGINEQYDDFIVEIDELGDADISDKVLDNPFTLPSSGVCSPSSFGTNYHGENMNFMTHFCEAYDAVLHPALRYLLYGLTVISLYRIYLSTVMRT